MLAVPEPAEEDSRVSGADLESQAAQGATGHQQDAVPYFEVVREVGPGQLPALETFALGAWDDSTSALQDSAGQSVAEAEDSLDQLEPWLFELSEPLACELLAPGLGTVSHVEIYPVGPLEDSAVAIEVGTGD